MPSTDAARESEPLQVYVRSESGVVAVDGYAVFGSLPQPWFADQLTFPRCNTEATVQSHVPTPERLVADERGDHQLVTGLGAYPGTRRAELN